MKQSIRPTHYWTATRNCCSKSHHRESSNSPWELWAFAEVNYIGNERKFPSKCLPFKIIRDDQNRAENLLLLLLYVCILLCVLLLLCVVLLLLLLLLSVDAIMYVATVITVLLDVAGCILQLTNHTKRPKAKIKRRMKVVIVTIFIITNGIESIEAL